MGKKNGVDPKEEDDSPSLPVMVIGKEKVDVRTFREIGKKRKYVLSGEYNYNI